METRIARYEDLDLSQAEAVEAAAEALAKAVGAAQQQHLLNASHALVVELETHEARLTEIRAADTDDAAELYGKECWRFLGAAAREFAGMSETGAAAVLATAAIRVAFDHLETGARL